MKENATSLKLLSDKIKKCENLSFPSSGKNHFDLK